MKYMIYGAGSLGTVMGAYLSKNGIDIQLVNRNKAHVEALNEHGAHVIGTVDMTVPVHAITPDQMQGPYDIIFLMTKQLMNRDVVTMLKPFLSENGVIVTLQNGIPEPLIAEIIGFDRTIGCVVEWGAELKSPGVVALTSSPDSLSFHMGGMNGIPADRIESVKKLLEKMCPVEVEDNLLGARWSKLLINATFSGLGTVIGGTFGDVTGNAFMRQVALKCMKECIDVGHAAGITFAPVQGKDITKLFYYKNPVKKAIASLILPIALKKHSGIVPSMLQDIRAGKPCQVDAINGVVCEYGKKYGVKTPVNDLICDLIKKEQNKNISVGKENMKYLKAIV